jgi:ComF family protein
VYGDDLREAVLLMKQARSESLAMAVGLLLADKCAAAGLAGQVDLLAPVPMHWQRRLWRGGSAADVLAESMAARLDRPLALRLLGCRRKTRKQGTLLPTQRRRNVLRAYRVSTRYEIRAAHVLVVDDVMTTGATLNEVARSLLRAGAARVSVAIVARGVGFG